ncbi:hypothetical protein BBK36DRAFT_1144453 [Trichoderma citrinoviride]|uniref:Uncharacterized protein n=1 Tax=Trichoderma citrinoviride TaxID=58853 RepID=A0A2T4B0R5_9HYPO|nr:hypothetical protein BBK36DRAFT_1144453 [Trichoderma citrinoviride]PTB62917.1 hypothetical protein BBK36DRAFT_1144453 [Trichoderma citrinoviride]
MTCNERTRYSMAINSTPTLYYLSQYWRASQYGPPTRRTNALARNVVRVSCCTIPASMSMDQGIESRTNTHRDRQIVPQSPYRKQYVERYRLVRLGIASSLCYKYSVYCYSCYWYVPLPFSMEQERRRRKPMGGPGHEAAIADKGCFCQM